MKAIDYALKLEESCIELGNALEILKCFDDFVSEEGTFLGNGIEEDKIVAWAFVNRIPQYRPLLHAVMDKIKNEIKNIMQANDDFFTCKTVLNNHDNNGVAQIPVANIRMVSDYEWQENCLKDRLEHPERYEKTEDVPAVIGHLKRWLHEHAEEKESANEI